MLVEASLPAKPSIDQLPARFARSCASLSAPAVKDLSRFNQVRIDGLPPRRAWPKVKNMMAISNDDIAQDQQEQGIEEALVDLLPKLKAHALYLTRSADRADDLLQRTCLRALSRSHQWQAGTRLDRWVSTIMNSIWFNELRKKRQRQEQELPEPDKVVSAGFEGDVQAQLMVSDIRRACSKLSDEDFVLVTKIHAYGFTYREVADELGVPIGTILSRVSRAKAIIKRTLAKMNEGEGA